jgi:NAD-dependent DNA ligase
MEESLKKSLITLKTAADEAYFNSGDPIMSDEAYDGLCTALTSKVSELSRSIGYKTRINRVKLPVHMGSLDKHNDEESLDKFLDKLPTNYVSVQEKLDGVSCLYHFHNGTQHIYTRGDGSTGSNISHILQYGFTISSATEVHTAESISDLMIRGELIVPKEIFDTKYASTFSNGRNMVSGLLSLKEPSADAFADVHFVAYELITFGNQSTAGGKAKSAFGRIQDQFNFLTLNKFRVVYNRVLEKNCLDVDSLTEYVSRRKKKSVYELDGLVLMTVEGYARNCDGNPDYACAFKILNETAITRVQRVEWNLSKHGKYKPRVITDPVKLGSVEVSAFTGFNAKYIVEKGVTPGSGLLVTRSGDTIPHILEVFSSIGTSSAYGVVLPDNAVWKSVDLYLCDRTCERTDKEEVEKKRLVHFLSSLKCLNCKYETVSKMFNAGFRTIEQLLETNVAELAEIDGIGSVLGKKILTSLHQNISKATTHELLAAMNAFGEGIGLKKIRLLNLNNPGEAVKGISQTTFDTKIFPVFDDKLKYARQLKKLARLSLNPQRGSEGTGVRKHSGTETDEEFEDKLSRRKVSSNLRLRSLEGRVFVFTGFRDGALENMIIDLGGRVTSAISNKSTDLVVDNNLVCKSSTKLIKARAQGIQIVTRKDLITYHLRSCTNASNSDKN